MTDTTKLLTLDSDDWRHIERAIRLLRCGHESPLADTVERIYKHALATTHPDHFRDAVNMVAKPAEAVEGMGPELHVALALLASQARKRGAIGEAVAFETCERILVARAFPDFSEHAAEAAQDFTAHDDTPSRSRMRRVAIEKGLPVPRFGEGEKDEAARCSECNATLEMVRPGKHQHPTCSQHPSAEAAQGAVAWLHDVVQDDGEPDQALSFAPDSFPMEGVGGFRSIRARPLIFGDTHPQAAPVHEFLAALGHVPKVSDRCTASVKPTPPEDRLPGPQNPPIFCCLKAGHDGPHHCNNGGMTFPSFPFRSTDEVEFREPVTCCAKCRTSWPCPDARAALAQAAPAQGDGWLLRRQLEAAPEAVAYPSQSWTVEYADWYEETQSMLAASPSPEVGND